MLVHRNEEGGYKITLYELTGHKRIVLNEEKA